jgi:hypothetical protein
LLPLEPLVPALLPLPATPLPRPPQPTIATSANTRGDQQPWLKTNGGSRTASSSHESGLFWRRESCSAGSREPRLARGVNVLDRLVLDHLADKLFTTARCRALAQDLIERSGLLRQRVDERRVQLRFQIEKTDKAIAKWQAAFESGSALDVVAPRLRDLGVQRAGLVETLDGLQALAPAPKDLLADETIKKFQDKLRDIFISNDTPMTKNYLRFLVEKIDVLDDRVVIEAKARNAVAMMAHPAPLEPGDVNHPEPVLAKGREWLRLLDSNQRPGG